MWFLISKQASSMKGPGQWQFILVTALRGDYDNTLRLLITCCPFVITYCSLLICYSELVSVAE